jgi:hypothetical protein
MPATYEPIATTTLGSAQSSVTFSAISGSFADLILVMNPKATAGTIYPYLQFNSDTATNYSYTWISGRSTNAAASGRSSNTSYIYLCAYAGVDTGNFNFNSIVQIQNYSNSNTYKTALARSNNASTSNIDAVVGLWRSTSAITSLTITADSSTFTSGSTFTLYGIKAA